MKTTAASHKPGDIVKIAGTEFAVLDVQKNAAEDGKDKLFVILKEPVESTVFSSDGNDYTESKLREKTDQWFEEFSANLSKNWFFSREISLLTMDGRANYGIMHRLAAPLTFDEWRKYSRYIPNSEKSYWLATGDGAPGCLGATYALFVGSNGDWGYGGCSGSCAVRPALVLSSVLLDDRENDLGRYTTEQLLEEILNRLEEESRNDTEAGESIG